jgi:hypothetical protein
VEPEVRHTIVLVGAVVWLEEVVLVPVAWPHSIGYRSSQAHRPVEVVVVELVPSMACTVVTETVAHMPHMMPLGKAAGRIGVDWGIGRRQGVGQ